MIMLINTAYYFSQCVLIPTYDFVLRWCEQRHNFRMEEIEQEYRHNKEKQELEHRQNIENQLDPKELYEKKYEKDRKRKIEKPEQRRRRLLAGNKFQIAAGYR